MELSVKDRLLLTDLLPAQGDITTLLVVREAQEALGFDSDERQALDLRVEDGRVFWDTGKEADKEIALSDATKNIIVEHLKALSDAKQLTMELLPVYERFMRVA